MESITQNNPKISHYISSEILADYFAKNTTEISVEETSNDFVFHIPKSYFMQKTDGIYARNDNALFDKRQRLAKLAGSWVGQFPERIQPTASERAELL